MFDFLTLFYDFLHRLVNVLFGIQFTFVDSVGASWTVSYGSFIVIGIIFAFAVTVFWRGARA